ncbi:hypothetical protein L7F22_059346 [Adiantum nelumboides]|nr:hypothetical protein [Adiantum nelumboides]
MAGLLDLSTRLGSGGICFQPLLGASPSVSGKRRPNNPFTMRANAVAPPPFAEETAPSSPILNKYSSRVTQPKSQGGSQAILFGVGLSEDDLHKPQVGISSVWYEGNTCNMHLLKLSEAVKEGVKDAGLVGFRFNTVGVSDAISMGTEGMCYSLQSRDLIADSIETVMGGQWYDANISIPGCDKNMPGTIIAMGRVNRPSIMIYGGTIKVNFTFCVTCKSSSQDEVWSFVRPVVSGDMQIAIMRPFSLQEVTNAVHGLDGASCPGDDGLTRQFFVQYWDLISQPLQEGLQEIFDTGIMLQSMSLGIISLTPKGGDASTLRQWRPITLMSSVYKILARMITSRLRPFLPDLIHSSQTGFVQDRSILDNVVTFYEAVEWACQTGQPTAIMLLDFEKAYDRVD